MNTTISLGRATASAPVARDLRAAVRSEWIKLRSVRSTAIFVGLATSIGVVMSLVLGKVVKDDPYDHLPFTIGNTFLVSTWLTTLFAVVAGTLVFTSEVQHGTLAGALTARPSRPTIVAAKAIVAAALGSVMGALGIVGGLVGGAMSGMDTGDMSGAVTGVAWALVLTTLAPVLGLGVGLVVRHAAGAATAVLVWALAIETVVRGMVPATVSRLMPFSAAHGLLGTRAAADTPETLAAELSNLGNAMVIGTWSVVALAIGTLLLNRRDA
ncbi:MAG: ABC transporter permease subunit [Ilumatobacteraceae bacterium]|nr:ABC transporter permease subunit [Ilumatobacteraceae bacterium]